MPKKLRTFQRPLGERRYKKLFVISVEGSKTEPQYFAIFNQPQSIISKKITLELIAKAISRAKQRDTNRSNDLPQIWSTTVYKLIERIIDHK